MVDTHLDHGNGTAENRKEAPNTLVITNFSRRRPDQKGTEKKLSNQANEDANLREIISQLEIPDSENLWNAHTSTQSSPTISQKHLTIPHSCSLNLSSLRHSPRVNAFERDHSAELIFDLWPSLPQNSQRPLKLALFDMDSTLINEEVIDELAASIGISSAVSAITARAMNGDIDFATSLNERVAMLKGVPVSVWDDLKKTVTIANGARELILSLKKRGVFTGVVSGGFTPMAEWLKGQLGLDVAIANHLLESPPTKEHPFPHLSGQLNPDFPIVTPQLKRSMLLQLSAERSFPLSEIMAVGDGSNDLLMLGAAGLGIAWRAKEKVQVAAPMRLNGESLAELLYLLGPVE